ncbi:MAG: DeoR/GlpR family DNA-binding transcription regulator [Hyphomicrobium sp.]
MPRREGLAMDYPTRWQSAILDTLKVDGQATIARLAERLNVSGETVRRHVKDLVHAGALHRVHGAVILSGVMTEPPFSRRMRERTVAKRAIAQAVAERVSDGMTLLIDSGSTTAYVAHALLQKRDLVVVTNSLDIARTLVGRCNHAVYLTGGAMRADIGAAVGPEARQLIEQFHADLAILSIGSIDRSGDFMDFDVDEARIAQAMIERADRVIVAADAFKYKMKAPVRVCRFDEVALLVTDDAPPPHFAKLLKEAGTRVVIAKPGAPAGDGARTLRAKKRNLRARSNKKRTKKRQSKTLVAP